jgi:hypothetical protein
MTDKDFDKNKLLKECRQTGRTTATTEKVLKTVFSQMTNEQTLEYEIKEYALEIEQKAKEIGKLKDILDRKEQQLKQMKETDISKVLIEGDTATIMGVKYKRVEEPEEELKTLYQMLYDEECRDDICYLVKIWMSQYTCDYVMCAEYLKGYEECLTVLGENLK